MTNALEVVGYCFSIQAYKFSFLKFTSNVSFAKPNGKGGKYIRTLGSEKNPPYFSNHCLLVDLKLNTYEFSL